MKLADALICISCDELLPRGATICACCTDTVLIPLSEWLTPITDRAEIELVHTIDKISK